jgi:hypothetical protein
LRHRRPKGSLDGLSLAAWRTLRALSEWWRDGRDHHHRRYRFARPDNACLNSGQRLLDLSTGVVSTAK